MRQLIKIILFILLMANSSCEELYLIDCSECYTVEPIEGSVEIKVYSNNHEGLYLINIYRGKLEDGIIIESFYERAFNTSTILPLNTEYTFTSTIEIDGITYTAVDSTVPKTYRAKETCDEICYIVVDNTVDLRLKYL